ncbi:response regulator [Fischerella thermalis]|jgi:two-component system cell cycle sensor histidine kinase/response regulator CckA|uniref:histidine kinase n=2 Tax=Fischerella TaxID=1190 RepID=G6FTH4_9CYAN|nr:response regulator [Fischerella thermalis]EHC13907.1 PAS/PAC sensor hybrid histidine kinase [Fischerella thermalis JSC-11]PLZ14758.1 hybrid sensor histidine kinase/response regulator [Fischerella thermalis WC114]PLZ18553.1 hybrid sensor histidine kinase/response regulator [Fischerella thermalis WC157]PLZ26526.1 hybrid sensor histidine kinase/response regulator [Fischerella thermalis WC558]PLZ27763.1 hybrid sensor histidine kinase/response regulator [Fischerella thermalis WC341]
MKSNLIRVLLIDDDEDDYILTRDWFKEFQVASCTLEWVNNYQAGRNAIASGQYDVYLVDYRLGDGNGLELLREAIAHGCTAPIIFLTGQGDREIDIEAMKAGAADYLEKSQLAAPLLERSIRYALERKQNEQKIREQAALLDVATDAIFVQDLDGKILFWNKAAEHLYKWKKEEAIGKKASELWQEKDLSKLQAALSILMKNRAWEGELQQITKTGQEITVESRWTLVKDFDNTTQCFLVVNTDITQKKLLESQFLRAQRLESIGTLASGIAHDLNNVLAPILMTAQLLESQLDDERSKRLLPILISNAKRGANLVKQVLSFTRGMEGDRTLLQLKHIVREIQQVIRETFPKSIDVSTSIPPSLWTIYGDATQLHQVLMNLCVNARDAMPNGGTLTICAENFLVDENYARMHLDAQVGAYVAITVADTGVGIAPEIIDRIFEPFYTTKEFGKGTGLGLSTVLGIVKSHGGFVSVYSEVGKGSQFKVFLPAQQTPESLEEPEKELPTGNGELILVVDDEDSIRDITKTSLETHNYKAITASDGIEAIALYAEHRDEISVVLTDMLMPSMDGLTTIRTLKKINPNVKIIAVSGLASTEKVNAAADIGVKAFLSKPYTAKQLLQTIGVVKSGK